MCWGYVCGIYGCVCVFDVLDILFYVTCVGCWGWGCGPSWVGSWGARLGASWYGCTSYVLIKKMP
jgi:hypothetical protein